MSWNQPFSLKINGFFAPLNYFILHRIINLCRLLYNFPASWNHQVLLKSIFEVLRSQNKTLRKAKMTFQSLFMIIGKCRKTFYHYSLQSIEKEENKHDFDFWSQNKTWIFIIKNYCFMKFVILKCCLNHGWILYNPLKYFAQLKYCI